MKVKLILAAVVILAVGAWAFTSFTSSMTSYVSLAEAQKRGVKVQVMGEIDHDKAKYDADKQLLVFPITDEEGTQVNVRYSGTMPGNFSEATHAVCVGKYENGEFVADQLLIKCPSKYQGEEI
jgi:cytochrome c-type biogenesis protein CcmE